MEVCNLTLGNDSIGIAAIRNKINNRTSFDLFEYAQKHLEQLYANNQHSTYKKYKSVIKKMRFYVQSDTRPIKSITPKFIKKYEEYLMTDLGNCRNTTTVNMKSLAKLVNDIFSHNDIDETLNPFRKMKFKREAANKGYLEIEGYCKSKNKITKPFV